MTRKKQIVIEEARLIDGWPQENNQTVIEAEALAIHFALMDAADEIVTLRQHLKALRKAADDIERTVNAFLGEGRR